MITIQQAHQIIQSFSFHLQTESVDLINAFGRVLSDNIVSNTDLPPFDKSAMDGYACRTEDLENILQVKGILAAGDSRVYEIGRNECVAIMTGSPVPSGANHVIMKEHVEQVSSDSIRFIGKNKSKNICYQAEDVKKGDVVLKASDKLHTAHIATLAALGITKVNVYKNPLVSIAVTGSEIVEPGEELSASKIYNSNGYQLLSQLKNMGVEACKPLIVKDDVSSIRKWINANIETNQLLILTGGVSVGDFDLVPSCLQEEGFEILFSKVAMKPGKPVCLAKRNQTLCLALSGNPVSSFLQFELFGKEIIQSLRGEHSAVPVIVSRFAKVLHLKKRDRTNLIPVQFNQQGLLVPLEFHGSAHIHALTAAHGMAIIEKEFPEEITTDLTVHVRLIQ